LKLSPLYTALIECEPTDKEDVVSVPTPFARLTALPKAAEPFMNWTAPVGPTPVTMAVKVTGWPKIAEYLEESTNVAEGARVIVSLIADEVLPALRLSPLYTAVIEFVPTRRSEVVSEATPPDNGTPAPRLLGPLRNSTVPVRLLPVTTAVNVTGSRATEGLADVATAVVVAVPVTV